MTPLPIRLRMTVGSKIGSHEKFAIQRKYSTVLSLWIWHPDLIGLRDRSHMSARLPIERFPKSNSFCALPHSQGVVHVRFIAGGTIWDSTDSHCDGVGNRHYRPANIVRMTRLKGPVCTLLYLLHRGAVLHHRMYKSYAGTTQNTVFSCYSWRLCKPIN